MKKLLVLAFVVVTAANLLAPDSDAIKISEKKEEPHYAAGHQCRITYPDYASLKPGKDTLYTIRVRSGCEGQFVSKNGFFETWRWYGAGKGYMTLTFEDGILALRQMTNLI
jgi:hypothetical protein